ncbi:zinc-binding dehydrogenase [Streptomyces sp. NPDC048611]|uniref:zinc-binding dehydrogenase n=1 Tax=Streptomyces sp. NPDC048611 TaxID=3155635 RepID=UPI003412C6C5
MFTRGELNAGEHLLAPASGGGVAGWALLLGKAAGARVTVTSRSAEKRARSLRMGADQALSSGGDWADELGRASVDLAVDGVGPAVFDCVCVLPCCRCQAARAARRSAPLEADRRRHRAKGPARGRRGL